MPALEHIAVPHDLEGIRKVVENLVERVGGLGSETTGDLDEDNINGVLSDTTDHTEFSNIGIKTHATIDSEINANNARRHGSTTHDALGRATDPTDAAAATATDPAVSSVPAVNGSGATTAQESAIDTNFTNFDTVVNALIADVADIRTQLNALLANMRTASQIA